MSIKNIEIPPGMQTAAFAMGDGALDEIASFKATVFPGRKPWIVADTNTWEAAGKKAAGLLPDAYEPMIFPGTPKLHPESSISDELAKKISAMPDCLPIAVGSGVINDIVKRAAGIAGVTYCCVPTASSVDGYTASGAAMSRDGFKMTLPCPAPYGLLVDTLVLQTAPAEMFASGYADLFAKVPAGGDWIIADALGVEKIDASIWELVQTPLRQRISDPGAFEPVFAGLAATGYAMQLYHDSRPASGAEHLLSHVWEMEKLSFNGEEVSHGFKVSIGTMTTTMLMEFIMNTDAAAAAAIAAPPLSVEARCEEIDRLLIKNCYGSGVRELALEKAELFGKYSSKTFEIWDSLRDKLAKQLISSTDAAALLRKADAPVHFSEIGLTEEQFIHGIRTAQLIRKRYTILDMLYYAGLLTPAIGYVIENFKKFAK